MDNKKIVFFEVEEEWEKRFFQEKFPDSVVTEEKLNGETWEKYKDGEIISTFLYSSLNSEILSRLSNLKCISTRSTGYDHIDLNYCKEKNIIVCNVPSYGATTVAEHTFALILAISRKLIPSIENTRKGDFSLKGLTGFTLSGKTLGVIGVGNIGGAVIRIAQCFGMKVVAVVHHVEDIKDFKDVKAVELDELLSTSDIISLHVPLTPATKHIINMNNMDKIKKGAVLINTARGGLIETQAIVDGLEKGIFSAVGIDVLEEECSLREERELLTSEFLKSCDLKTELLEHVLIDSEKALITPHNAFNSMDSLNEILGVTVENIEDFLKGSPQNRV